MKELVAERVPPGDRWALINEDSDIVFGSLTDCLNQIFVVHKATQFFIDAKKVFFIRGRGLKVRTYL